MAGAAQLEERRQRLIRSFCTKGPVYENCRMLSHDGEPLSFIDHRKLSWNEVGFCPHSLAVIQPVTLHCLFSWHTCVRLHVGAYSLFCLQRRAHHARCEWTGKRLSEACPNMLHCVSNPILKEELRRGYPEWWIIRTQARGLAERVAEDPPTIRLLFRHKNVDQVTGTDQLYSERKRNCCVACGEAQHYLRYRVRFQEPEGSACTCMNAHPHPVPGQS